MDKGKNGIQHRKRQSTPAAEPARDGRRADPEAQVRYLGLPRLENGTVINGRYRVENLIGKGGFGLVFAGGMT